MTLSLKNREAALPHALNSGRCCTILGMRIDELDGPSLLAQVQEWAVASASRYVCFSTVHGIMESYDDERLRALVNAADLVVSDGMPVVWVSRHRGLTWQQRVFGPDVTVCLCELAARHGIPVGFYGSTPEVLEDLRTNLVSRFPALTVAFYHSPPFRPLHQDEDDEIVRQINESGTRILFVGLGCPKQERWMAQHRGRIHAVMLGVGWAFDLLAGHSKRAPRWTQQIGMEWFYRILLDPKRLLRRHLKHNPRFILFVARQLWQQRRKPLE